MSFLSNNKNVLTISEIEKQAHCHGMTHGSLGFAYNPEDVSTSYFRQRAPRVWDAAYSRGWKAGYIQRCSSKRNNKDTDSLS